MLFAKVRRYANRILNLLFPERPSSRRTIFDFSGIPPPKLSILLPKIRDQNKNAGVIACLQYKNPLTKTLVWHIKTKRDRHAFAGAGYILAEKIREMVPIFETERAPIIIPMPIHYSRRRERGYNQCELLAVAIGRHCEIEIRTDLLFRLNPKKETTDGNHFDHAKKQAFKNRSERIAGVKGVFFVNEKSLRKISGSSSRIFIVLDDVVTTGSTINEALSTLRKAGCKNVRGLALAH